MEEDQQQEQQLPNNEPPNENNQQPQQQQQQPQHLWLQHGPFADHQEHLRQILQQEPHIRHWNQQVRAWQQHRENDFEEVQQQQQDLPELRSKHNRHSSFVRFINTVSTTISVYWIDYQGAKVFYRSLARGDYLDINTFVTHPWIFIDDRTRMRYVANDQFVYFPEPWFAKYQGMDRIELPARIERTNVYIRMPMRTLKELCLWAITLRLGNDQDIYKLELPKILELELLAMRAPKPDKQLP